MESTSGNTECLEDFFKSVECNTTYENSKLPEELVKLKIMIENIEKKMQKKKDVYKREVITEKKYCDENNILQHKIDSAAGKDLNQTLQRIRFVKQKKINEKRIEKTQQRKEQLKNNLRNMEAKRNQLLSLYHNLSVMDDQSHPVPQQNESMEIDG